jgi:hypothetical protein
LGLSRATQVFITEFGGNLNVPNLNYEQPAGASADNSVACFQGLNDGVVALRQAGFGIRGAFHWHGWLNGDSFSFFEADNKNGSTKVLKVLNECCAAR